MVKREHMAEKNDNHCSLLQQRHRAAQWLHINSNFTWINYLSRRRICHFTSRLVIQGVHVFRHFPWWRNWKLGDLQFQVNLLPDSNVSRPGESSSWPPAPAAAPAPARVLQHSFVKFFLVSFQITASTQNTTRSARDSLRRAYWTFL